MRTLKPRCCPSSEGSVSSRSHSNPPSQMCLFLNWLRLCWCERHLQVSTPTTGYFLDCDLSAVDWNQVWLRRWRLRGVHGHGVALPTGHQKHHVSFNINPRPCCSTLIGWDRSHEKNYNFNNTNTADMNYFHQVFRSIKAARTSSKQICTTSYVLLFMCAPTQDCSKSKYVQMSSAAIVSCLGDVYTLKTNRKVLWFPHWQTHSCRVQHRAENQFVQPLAQLVNSRIPNAVAILFTKLDF